MLSIFPFEDTLFEISTSSEVKEGYREFKATNKNFKKYIKEIKYNFRHKKRFSFECEDLPVHISSFDSGKEKDYIFFQIWVEESDILSKFKGNPKFYYKIIKDAIESFSLPKTMYDLGLPCVTYIWPFNYPSGFGFEFCINDDLRKGEDTLEHPKYLSFDEIKQIACQMTSEFVKEIESRI